MSRLSSAFLGLIAALGITTANAEPQKDAQNLLAGVSASTAHILDASMIGGNSSDFTQGFPTLRMPSPSTGIAATDDIARNIPTLLISQGSQVDRAMRDPQQQAAQLMGGNPNTSNNPLHPNISNNQGDYEKEPFESMTAQQQLAQRVLELEQDQSKVWSIIGDYDADGRADSDDIGRTRGDELAKWLSDMEKFMTEQGKTAEFYAYLSDIAGRGGSDTRFSAQTALVYAIQLDPSLIYALRRGFDILSIEGTPLNYALYYGVEAGKAQWTADISKLYDNPYIGKLLDQARAQAGALRPQLEEMLSSGQITDPEYRRALEDLNKIVTGKDQKFSELIIAQVMGMGKQLIPMFMSKDIQVGYDDTLSRDINHEDRTTADIGLSLQRVDGGNRIGINIGVGQEKSLGNDQSTKATYSIGLNSSTGGTTGLANVGVTHSYNQTAVEQSSPWDTREQIQTIGASGGTGLFGGHAGVSFGRDQHATMEEKIKKFDSLITQSITCDSASDMLSCISAIEAHIGDTPYLAPIQDYITNIRTQITRGVGLREIQTQLTEKYMKWIADSKLGAWGISSLGLDLGVLPVHLSVSKTSVTYTVDSNQQKTQQLISQIINTGVPVAPTPHSSPQLEKNGWSLWF